MNFKLTKDNIQFTARTISSYLIFFLVKLPQISYLFRYYVHFYGHNPVPSSLSLQVVKILEKHDPLRSNTSSNMAALGVIGGPMRFGGPIPGDEASAVQNYVEHMLFLLMEEDAGQAGAMGPILEFVVMENVMERLFLWSLRRQFTDDMKLEQLKVGVEVRDGGGLEG